MVPTDIREQIRSEEEAAARPFDPRTDVSADAKHVANRIVLHLYLLLLLIPFIVFLFQEIVTKGDRSHF